MKLSSDSDSETNFDLKKPTNIRFFLKLLKIIKIIVAKKASAME